MVTLVRGFSDGGFFFVKDHGVPSFENKENQQPNSQGMSLVGP
jgi:hypothetical protein